MSVVVTTVFGPRLNTSSSKVPGFRQDTCLVSLDSEVVIRSYPRDVRSTVSRLVFPSDRNPDLSYFDSFE